MLRNSTKKKQEFYGKIVNLPQTNVFHYSFIENVSTNNVIIYCFICEPYLGVYVNSGIPKVQNAMKILNNIL